MFCDVKLRPEACGLVLSGWGSVPHPRYELSLCLLHGSIFGTHPLRRRNPLPPGPIVPPRTAARPSSRAPCPTNPRSWLGPLRLAHPWPPQHLLLEHLQDWHKVTWSPRFKQQLRKTKKRKVFKAPLKYENSHVCKGADGGKEKEEEEEDHDQTGE